MTQSDALIEKVLLERSLTWFHEQFGRNVLDPIGSHFPNYQVPREIDAVVRGVEEVWKELGAWHSEPLQVTEAANRITKFPADHARLLKQAILLYRRHRAAQTEQLAEKTFHLELTATLGRDVQTLDALVGTSSFQSIPPFRLPRLKDFLPIKYVEAIQSANDAPIPDRAFDEKFQILQAPGLFLSDLAYLRARCEDREIPLAVGFFDIDNFKQFNTEHSEAKVDRNLLPRFMQTLEAHLFHHGYAYRQGGDEYLVLIPGLSKPLALAFLDELRKKLAELQYPEIAGTTTVSIGLCIVEPDSPLTDRELRERAGLAKSFAKQQGKNCIATYDGARLLPGELRVVMP